MARLLSWLKKCWYGWYDTAPHCIAGVQVQQHPPKREPEREEWTEVLANGGHQEQY